jgi:autotransporter-associated beta strand protein
MKMHQTPNAPTTRGSSRATLTAAALLTLAAMPAYGATVYWDGADTGANAQGGAGTWDTTVSNTNWDTAAIGGSDTFWTNGNTAVFGGVASTSVALGSAVDVGSLTFNTTGYTITTTGQSLNFAGANNTVLLNNVAAAIITGPVGGSGNVILDSSNKATAGSLTLNSSGTGWSGSTTVNAGTTLAVGVTSNALASTSAINITGGTITFTKSGSIGNQIADGAAITFTSGGTFQQTNNTGGPHTETVGAVTVASGQANIGITNGASSSGVVLTLSGLSRSSNTAAVATYLANTSQTALRVSGAADTTANQIIGPWATFGTSAAVQTDYAIYTGGNGTLAAANIAGTAENTWASGADVTLNTGSAVALSGTRTVNSLKFIGATSTLTLGDFNLETYGVLWGGAIANKNILGTGTGILTTPTGGGNLFLTVGQNVAHTVSATIGDNGGAVTLVKGGSNGSILDLTGSTNTYSGGTVLNAGTLRITADANLGDAAGDIIFNGNATLNMNTATPLTFGAGRTVTVNQGAAATMTSGNGGKTFNGVLEGAGSLFLNHTTSFSFLNTANTFTGTLTTATGGVTSYGLELASIGDGTGVGLINFGNGGTAGTLRWLGSSGSTSAAPRAEPPSWHWVPPPPTISSSTRICSSPASAIRN